ncbi:hypothetical protein [Deinococcus peraridilitoris]|uniref:Uncharacterized protein n=1 Tax=Deinococcus peraridilitoris (strain DSM 19664 / LMG 22246 / CIP 109416 / KR-200) TaxID=937777 RepID=L0A0G7_DEIPD|nr:hypothetical protein [Deinococcus peraridilitoris]AFZ67388.1 hypothetical protein Deipe_1872 [Deinococcus peraridilitoris DSM 19664]
MNYAATLAVLMVLAFVFPLLVRLAADYGVARSTTTTTLFVLAAFGFAVASIRARVTTHRSQLERLATVKKQIEQDPFNPRAFFVEGEHVGAVLLQLGRRREASEMIDRYAQLGGARESEILSLKEALTRTERRQRREA